jgi:hypothetical protein
MIGVGEKPSANATIYHIDAFFDVSCSNHHRALHTIKKKSSAHASAGATHQQATIQSL